MFPFKQTFPKPKEHTQWVNTCEYIIVHHTGTGEWTIKWVLDGLYKRDDYASCHFVVDTNGDAYKIGDPKDILWHAGESSWKWKKDMNKYSVWIEIIWQLADGGFTAQQKNTVRELTQHLMAALNISPENVLRHKDIAPKRKVDVADSFWKVDSWADYQKSLIKKQV